MIGRLAWRSLTAHPVRSAVLAAGFGFGVTVMAILLGVAQVVLEQAASPALVGGGDVIIYPREEMPARMLLSGTLQADGMRSRVRAASPSEPAELYLIGKDTSTPVRARGGIPSLERAMHDTETSGVAAWRDTPADVAWTLDTPERMLLQIDRFHPIPDVPEWSSSWAEWLYFNGRANGARFYLTFLVGPRTGRGGRAAGVRLQIERDGRMSTFTASDELTDAEVERAPNLAIGRSRIRLDGMRYQIHLDLPDASGRRAVGDLTLTASPGKLVPPIEIAGARGWVTGYVVPVMSGALDGTIVVGADRVPLDGGTGYHDHNWGFWQGVSWQWGQLQHEDLSFLYGRVFPPSDAADAERMPGFLGALGPDGPIGYATNVRITETNDDNGRPMTIEIRALGPSVDLTLLFKVAAVETTRMSQGPLANGVDFLQIRGQYTVTGRVGQRQIDAVAAGTAETFRGQPGPETAGPQSRTRPTNE
jgi:hypothetical protein